MDDESDVELFVVLPEYDWQIEKQVSDVCFDADLEIGRIICPLIVSEDELKNSPLRASRIVAVVALEGVAL